MFDRNFIRQHWLSKVTVESSGKMVWGNLDSPEHRVSPQPPVSAPGGQFWILPNLPAPGGWYAAAAPPLLSPSQRSWCTAAGSRPALGGTQRTRKLSAQLKSMNFYLQTASDFQISCETTVCIMHSNRTWYHLLCQNMCCKSVKCEHRLYFAVCECEAVCVKTRNLTHSPSSTVLSCIFSFKPENAFS